MNMTLLNRSGLAAIAAATAFMSIPASAQDAAPVTESAPIVADTPLPSEPANPPAANSDPLAPAATTTTTTTKTTRTTRPTRATAAPARSVTRTTTTRTIAPVAAPAPAATIPAPIEAPADPAMVAPLPEQPVTVPAPAPVQSSSMLESDVLPIAGAAGLGILALAGAGFAMRRRRRNEEELVEESWHEPAMSRPAEPTAPIAAQVPIAAAPMVATPAAVAAFNWGNATPQPAPVAATARAQAPTMSRIEAAKRGPTPDNPSASLKKRLARASFFDQRERMVAAGKAAPVSATAGLPKAMTDQSTATAPAAPSATRSKPAMRIGYNSRFQPA